MRRQTDEAAQRLAALNGETQRPPVRRRNIWKRFEYPLILLGVAAYLVAAELALHPDSVLSSLFR